MNNFDKFSIITRKTDVKFRSKNEAGLKIKYNQICKMISEKNLNIHPNNNSIQILIIPDF